MDVVFSSVTPTVLTREGGALLQLTGTWPLGVVLNAYVGPAGSTSDPACYSGIPGQGDDLYALSPTTLECYCPVIAPGVSNASLTIFCESASGLPTSSLTSTTTNQLTAGNAGVVQIADSTFPNSGFVIIAPYTPQEEGFQYYLKASADSFSHFSPPFFFSHPIGTPVLYSADGFKPENSRTQTFSNAFQVTESLFYSQVYSLRSQLNPRWAVGAREFSREASLG